MLTLTFPLVLLASLSGFMCHVVPDHHVHRDRDGDQSQATPCVDFTGIYPHGESWLCEDGCNTCSCINGLVTSTAMACPKSCVDTTGTHRDGESWRCADGCNKCFCRNGFISSTERVCPKSCVDTTGTHLDGDSWLCADGCNKCFCRNGVISSTRMLCIPTPNPPVCPCTREFVPVCGEDGKQYGNKCLALCNNTRSQCEEGSCPCPEKIDDKKKESSCTCPAPDIRDPVCGVDGRTYRSRCHAYCEEVDVDCEGECICIRSA